MSGVAGYWMDSSIEIIKVWFSACSPNEAKVLAILEAIKIFSCLSNGFDSGESLLQCDFLDFSG